LFSSFLLILPFFFSHRRAQAILFSAPPHTDSSFFRHRTPMTLFSVIARRRADLIMKIERRNNII
jgi:hypothetical protein